MRNERVASLSFSSIVAIAVAAPACGSAAQGSSPTGRTEEPDRIGANENPARLIPGASSRLADNIAPEDVGETFGTDEAHIPYPDDYWPYQGGGIDRRWDGGPSPLEKYMAVVDPAHADAARRWEHDHHGPGVADVKLWNGHCDGWTAAAMATTPIQHAVYARSDADGGIRSCHEGEPECVKFEIGDINGLAAEAFLDVDRRFIGARCDVKPDDIRRNDVGRIVRDGTGCHGLNPGALLVVLGQEMKRLHRPLAIDAQTPFVTDQIWNQPAYRYAVHRYETISTPEAANLVAHGQRTGDRTAYEWNGDAAAFVLVDIGIQWVREYGPNMRLVSGAATTRETRVVAVIELDAPPSDPGARIIGGEYLDDSRVGADRLTVPPFVWTVPVVDADSEEARFTGHARNPYVEPKRVLQLITLGERLASE